mmetsp:Transcript_175802/g.427567  ORF Transcript_175802/g.427567 Transcript_175802/m.427567 type:complete len:230 (-) Transcript_175802:7-696(-)
MCCASKALVEALAGVPQGAQLHLRRDGVEAGGEAVEAAREHAEAGVAGVAYLLAGGRPKQTAGAGVAAGHGGGRRLHMEVAVVELGQRHLPLVSHPVEDEVALELRLLQPQEVMADLAKGHDATVLAKERPDPLQDLLLQRWRWQSCIARGRLLVPHLVAGLSALGGESRGGVGRVAGQALAWKVKHPVKGGPPPAARRPTRGRSGSAAGGSRAQRHAGLGGLERGPSP